MAITSAGYTGTVDQVTWAKMATFAGVDTAVASSTDCVVTGASGTRVVSVSPGVAWGWGVLDTLSGTNTVALAANGTGATRYDAVCLRRNWGSISTSLVAITGGSTLTVPGLTVNPGVQADQVLALVAVPAGATSLVGASVTSWAQWPAQMTSGAKAPDSPTYGQTWLDPATGTIWRYGAGDWDNVTNPAWSTLTLASGFTSNGAVPVGYRFRGGRIEMRGEIRKTSSFTTGWSATMATIPVGYRPVKTERFAVATGGSDTQAATVEISTAGVVRAYIFGTSIDSVYLSPISWVM